MGKKVMIVFEETEGAGFNVYLDGVPVERRSLPQEELSAAEYHGLTCFRIVTNALSASGAVVNVKKREPSTPS